MSSLSGLRWCPRCEWNLDRYDPDVHGRTFGWRRGDRWAHAFAYRSNGRLYRALADRDLTSPATTLARATLVILSLSLLAMALAALAAGGFLVVRGFPSLTIVPGVLLILVALVLRPRFGRIEPLLERVERRDAPALFGLLDQVAGAAGVPPPQVVGFDRSLNCSTGAVGLRRRRVLQIGLPLWMLLPDQQRVALLAHEMGHFANGDIRRGPVTQPAYQTLGMLAALTAPDRRDIDRTETLLWFLSAYVSYLVLAVVHHVLTWLYLALVWIGMREGHRAEYLADDRAAAVAGSAAASGLFDSLLTIESVAPMLSRAARESGEAAAWRSAAEASRQRIAASLPAWRQRSLSADAYLFSSHPPRELRRRMVASRPWRSAAVVLTEPAAARIDAELAPMLARARRSIGALA